jgi:integrase-like protein
MRLRKPLLYPLSYRAQVQRSGVEAEADKQRKSERNRVPNGGKAKASADRQRLRLPLHHPRARLQNARHPPPPQPALRPQTNGKAERFIRTMLNGWAYAAIYRSSHERATALDGWLWHYIHRRRHSALGHQPPVSRTNLLGSYS